MLRRLKKVQRGFVCCGDLKESERVSYCGDLKESSLDLCVAEI